MNKWTVSERKSQQRNKRKKEPNGNLWHAVTAIKKTQQQKRED